MMPLAMIGLLGMGAVISVGIYYLITNITFKKEPNRYTYEDDSVIDNNEDTKE